MKHAKTEENVNTVSEGQLDHLKLLAPVAAETNAYFLITGSFKSEENAVSQVNMLKEEGFTPEIVAAPNGFYRVSAMMCSDLNTAKSKKTVFRKNSREPGFQKRDKL